MMMRVRMVGVMIAGVALFHATGAVAGPITPPPGPVTPTPGPEPRIAINAVNTPGDADSMFRITQSGSYYLTVNVTGVAAKHGIEIAAWGVTIDLCGFEMVGTASGTLDGISVNAGGPKGVSILNGTVRGWGGDGVRISLANGGRVEGVVATDNLGDGLALGDYMAVSGCSSYNNEGIGIIIGFGTSLTNSAAASNGGNGISVGTGCTVTNCSSLYSGANGITLGSNCVLVASTSMESGSDGVRATGGSAVIDCVVSENTLDGIDASSDCVITGNTCHDNGTGTSGGAGIHVTGSGCRVVGNVCTDSQIGVDVDASGSFIGGNTCSGNLTNWSVAAGNVCFVVNAATNAAFSGDSGGTSPGSTGAWTNFTY